MAYKILYIDDQETSSREADLRNLGFEIIPHKPTNNFKAIEEKVRSGIDAIILDYKLTEGEGEQACFDAPTIAQFVRTMHSSDGFSIPVVLMSNQEIFTENYNNDYTSQDLFDFTITKQYFTDNQKSFGKKLNSFIEVYKKIKSDNSLYKSLNIRESDVHLHSRFVSAFKKYIPNLEKKQKLNQFNISSLIYDDLLCSISLTIGEDFLSARLGVSKESNDWNKLLNSLEETLYLGVFSDIKKRWWMEKVNKWWSETISSETTLRRLNAVERVALLKTKLNLDLIPLEKTKHSVSSNF